jgi:hypothetical protein
LEQIQQNWFDKELPDPKKEHFVEIISGQIIKDPKRKIIVFSSYSDTINDLYDKLIERGIRAFKYTSKEASKTNKETIKLNFDAGKKTQENETESWETKYRELLNRAKGTPEHNTAQNIPHRSRIGRIIEKKRKGVLLFGRKKDVCVFKMWEVIDKVC